MNNKIHQAGQFRAIEAPAAGTIFPGHLCEQAAGGGLQVHSTAGGFAEKIVAQEDALQGGTTQGVFYNGSYVGYTVAGINGAGPDPVNAYVEQSGSLSLMILKAGTNYTVGTKLISNGDGTLKATTGSPTQIIAVIPQGAALDLSASGAVATLNQVRMM